MIELLDHTADVGFELGTSTHKALVDEVLLKVFSEPPPGEHDGIFVGAGGRATVDGEILEACEDAAIEATHGVALLRPRLVFEG